MSDVDINDLAKDIAKINRTIIRLKHSIRFDREMRVMDREAKVILTTGALPRLETSLADLLSES